jgi:hypothetical protein
VLSAVATGASNYQWYANGKPIYGANASSYQVYYKASYFVAATINGCRIASTPQGITNASFDTLSKQSYTMNGSMMVIKTPAGSAEEISIYPNPSNDQFTVQYLPDSGGEIVFEIVDSMGDRVDVRKFLSGTGKIIASYQELNLASGIYVLVIADGEKRVVKMIQIE